jgi:hypothetical protein
MGEVKQAFTKEEFDLAMMLAVSARIGYREKLLTKQELRDRYDYIRSIIHHPPMTDDHFQELLRLIAETK